MLSEIYIICHWKKSVKMENSVEIFEQVKISLNTAFIQMYYLKILNSIFNFSSSDAKCL